MTIEASSQKPEARVRFVKRFQDLEVYKLSCRLAQEIFEVSKSFPPEEKYSLTDQLRRASRSIGAQISESWAKRRYPRHFVSKLTDADGELQETLHWLGAAVACGYLIPEIYQPLSIQCADIGKMLSGMIAKAERFRGPQE